MSPIGYAIAVLTAATRWQDLTRGLGFDDPHLRPLGLQNAGVVSGEPRRTDVDNEPR